MVEVGEVVVGDLIVVEEEDSVVEEVVVEEEASTDIKIMVPLNMLLVRCGDCNETSFCAIWLNSALEQFSVQVFEIHHNDGLNLVICFYSSRRVCASL